MRFLGSKFYCNINLDEKDIQLRMMQSDFSRMLIESYFSVLQDIKINRN